MKKKFAFLLMGKEFDTAKDTAVFETEHMISYIFTVTSFEEALKRAVAWRRGRRGRYRGLRSVRKGMGRQDHCRYGEQGRRGLCRPQPGAG